MVRLRYKLVLVGAVLLAVFVWASGYRRGANRHVVSGLNAIPILPKNETERITVNPGSHTVTIQTPTGTKTETLPDRKSTFDVDKNGKVKMTVSQTGFECHPFIGWQVSNVGRLSLGADIWYIKKFDLGLGVADQFGEHTPVVLAKISYNFWSNCQIGITYDTSSHIGGMLSVRI